MTLISLLMSRANFSTLISKKNLKINVEKSSRLNPMIDSEMMFETFQRVSIFKNLKSLKGYVKKLICERLLLATLIAFSSSLLLSCASHESASPKNIGAMKSPHASSTQALSETKENSGTGPLSGGAQSLRQYDEKILPNGLHIVFVPDDALPYFTLSMLIQSGSERDPDKLAGLTQMVAELLDKGSDKRKAPQIAQDLAQMGADFSAHAGFDFVHLNLSGLSSKSEKVLENFAEIILQPAFSNSEIERTRKQMLAQIERRVDNAENFAGVAFDEYIYGSHPYGHALSGTRETIQAIKKRNVIQQYLRFYRPENAILAVVGKFTPDMRSKIETAFSSWQKRDVAPMEFHSIAPTNGLQIQVVDKPGSVQAQIRIGGVGIKRTDPDFLPLRVANTILGGAFSSRLGDRVRIKLGLTYSISSEFDARGDYGPFQIATFTKNASTGQAISETLAVLSEFRNKGVSDKELASTKGYLKGIFPAAIETPEKFALNLLLLRRYGVPDSYLTNYISEIDKITAKQLNSVIKQHFEDKNLKVLVYTNASEVLPQLKAISPSVEVKKFSDYF